jgi:protein SCO1
LTVRRRDCLARLGAAVGGLTTAGAGASREPDALSATRWDWKPPVWPDVEVTDQAGRKLRFARDLLTGRTVAISFVFTTCSSICSPISAGLASVQRRLQPRMGRDIHLVSITIDPLTDTPAVLAQYGAKFEAGPGWTFVTGARGPIERILAAFGIAAGGDLSDHSPYLYVGNEPARAWTRVHGLSDPRVVAAVLERAAARGPAEGARPRGS